MCLRLSGNILLPGEAATKENMGKGKEARDSEENTVHPKCQLAWY